MHAARSAARNVLADPETRRQNLRHNKTWFVGVDALPTDAQGALGEATLEGLFRPDLDPIKTWPKAQLSVVYPGYPGRDPGESDGAHRYRLLRAAAHVDGLLAVGPEQRRFPLELHAFLLGIPLGTVTQSPTLCWPGSHHIIGPALLEAVGASKPSDVDVTDAYVTARAEVFRKIRPVPLIAQLGGAYLVHRFVLHGTAPWEDRAAVEHDGRMVAFFRPEVASEAQWLHRDWE
ncbi:MAG: hypothetical protein AAGF79_05920 [Pseudomonadota bacterium]